MAINQDHIDMSLDVYLESNEEVNRTCRTCNREYKEREELFWKNITHNLVKMAKAAGIYMPLWRPDELGIKKAGELVDPLVKGLARLEADPDKFKRFNPENGWGSYEVLVEFVKEYLSACIENKEAIIEVSR